MAMMACAAGKDVYVEKPLSVFVQRGTLAGASREEAWPRRTGRHAATQRYALQTWQGADRERPHRQGASPSVPAAYRNIMPGFGAPPDGAAPSDFDYDMWLGPAPKRPFNPHRGIYHFRWFWDYSGGQMTNLGAHSIDIVQWYLGVKGPMRVCSFGGRRALEDNGETPDMQDADLRVSRVASICSIPSGKSSAGSRAGGRTRVLRHER